MDKHYDPHAIEAKWYDAYLEGGGFHADAEKPGEPYCIMIPPPNVTGILHMGHALNNTIQDILIRWRRMQGRNAMWMPGTDHAGIATQNVVERALREEGKTRDDLGREAFVQRVWEWREQYGSTIISQLKKLGSACDWERERFTLDEGLSDAVAEVFVRLYNKGLIYRANYIINWCPRCETALSDEESEHEETDGKLYYLKYPVGSPDPEKAKQFLVVATTRPETLLGDVAVAVNPGDERYENLKNEKIYLPILGRELAWICDDFVDPKFGTGIVKVTPAHDPNDFQMGRRHELTSINVMHGNGTMNEEAGPYAGLDRFECRKRILADLKAAGLVEKIEKHRHAIGHCYRCQEVVEPRLSPQWFVRMKPLAEPAVEAVKSGRVEFIPARWTKVYLEWMENIRDWCISRQIWWGHRIPVFTCDDCGHEWAAKGRPDACAKCGSGGIHQDEDVLDTWFSSWLWPFSTLGWPGDNPDLRCFYPTHDLVTASEIIFFWVARMVMAGLEFMGDVPFSKVYIHGTVRANDGRKMSKSLGNSIDPLTIIDQFSADALRFSLIMITATGQDVYVSNDKFEIGRNFGTKLWNAARFLKMQSEGDNAEAAPFALSWREMQDPGFAAELLSTDDRHILARLQQAIADCEAGLDKFRFNDAAHVLYEFVWHQFCDWYVEYAKSVLYGADAARREQVLRVMHFVFEQALRLLHPLMPFVTEELWHEMGYGAPAEFLLGATWPTVRGSAELKAWGVDRDVLAYVDAKHDLIRDGRTLRADYGIGPTVPVDYLIKPSGEKEATLLLADKDGLATMLKAKTLTIDLGLAAGKKMSSAVSKLGTVYMPLAGLVDMEAETLRLQTQLQKIEGDLARIAAKLQNEAFVNKAPKSVVDQQKTRKRELLEKNEKIKRQLATLAGN